RVILGTVMGLVNAFGNLGGWAGNYAFGWLKEETGDIVVPFSVLGGGLLLAALLCFLLPKRKVIPISSVDNLSAMAKANQATGD
ncbi:MAG TPA: hypothetical protein VFA77_02600, partial [Candidatus Eisenbacteria bacterium]|nr:hypothetical protein [Candidatus Eisenbacteria bacterium]